jgi:hypothetical protein
VPIIVTLLNPQKVNDAQQVAKNVQF